MNILNKIRNAVDDVAEGYEPVVVASVVTASFTLAAGLGITVGDLPQQVDAILTFLAFGAPLLGGLITRAKVTPVKKIRHY